LVYTNTLKRRTMGKDKDKERQEGKGKKSQVEEGTSFAIGGLAQAGAEVAVSTPAL
jgi:hypothetical protein